MRVREETRNATGLSLMNCLPQIAAYRPAGTREALPGSVVRS
jgi:hypothetical protein